MYGEINNGASKPDPWKGFSYDPRKIRDLYVIMTDRQPGKHRGIVPVGVFLVILEGVVLYFGINHQYWGDEVHFVRTVRLFGEGLTLDTLRHYNEMSPPLPFMVYALWGRLFGFELQVLRLLSVVIAIATYLAFYQLLFSCLDNRRMAFITTAFLALHPYMIGLSIFVFTDMLAIFFLVLGCVAIWRKSPLLFGLSSMLGLLCRQYFAFLPVAAGLFFLLKYLKSREYRARNMVLAVLLSFLPLAMLFLFWGGLSPQNELRTHYLLDDLYFHPGFLVLYILLYFVYLLPFVLWRWKYFYKDLKILGSSAVISLIYVWFPVTASRYAEAAGVDTVGFYHRLVRYLAGEQWEHVVLYLSFLLGLPLLIALVRDGYRRWIRRDLGFVFFLDLAILAFFIFMPFSYLNWEKYFLLVMPLAVLQIILVREEELSPLASTGVPAGSADLLLVGTPSGVQTLP